MKPGQKVQITAPCFSGLVGTIVKPVAANGLGSSGMGLEPVQFDWWVKVEPGRGHSLDLYPFMANELQPVAELEA